MTPLTMAPMTELDAVNVMLMSIGQAPVNTLTVPGIKDVSFAQLTLHNVNRNVQTRGWWFNRETNYPLPMDGAGQIPLPANLLHIEPVDRTRDLVERGRILYDKTRHTSDFTGQPPLTADVIFLLPYDQIPQAARNYVATRAARLFQANNVGSQVLHQFTSEEEAFAYAEMNRTELRSKNTNSLTANTHVNRIHRRR